MKLGYVILYVPDVQASMRFHEQAFGLKRRFLHESGAYGELDSGDTTLAFASFSQAESNLPACFVPAHGASLPLGMEIALVSPQVSAAHARALAHGATELSPPTTKPWGQVVSYVRAPDGCLIELCTPVGS
jgi:catechol 2,3-dioxygenase-like lactoylglutathione lyase family enzyme